MGKRRRSIGELPDETGFNGDNRGDIDDVDAGDVMEHILEEGEEEVDDDCEDDDDEPTGAGPSPPSLGAYIWGEVSMALYVSMLKQLHHICGCIAIQPSSEERRKLIAKARTQTKALWDLEMLSSDSSEQEDLAEYFHSQISSLLDNVTSLAESDMKAGELCQAFLQTLNMFGFPEEENLDEVQLQANIRKSAELQCYSYQQRTSNQLNVLRRYEGDRRSEDQYLQPRVGRVVRFPIPHPHEEVNTRIQLIEPKRRRPPLEENRICSHPKRATAFGMEDVLVDEELQFRALVMLGRHLDTFCSIQHISPYLRLTVWNLLDRDEEIFERLCEVPKGDDDTAVHLQLLTELRQRVARKRMAFESTRVGARECVARLTWSAVSARWRDQVLCAVEEVEDADWCLLRDSAKVGTRAIFPNYAVCSAVRDIALKALRRVRDGTIDCGGIDDAADCYEVIARVLVPILEGGQPMFPMDDTSDSDGEREREACRKKEPRGKAQRPFHYGELCQRFATLMSRGEDAELTDTKVARSVRWNLNCETLLAEEGVVCTFLTGMFVWPLQCLASFLELVAAGRHSVDGLRKFSAAFIPSNWSDERGVLEYLLRREPTNLPLTAFVAFPRLIRDVYISARWLLNDKCFAAVVACRREACKLPSNKPAINFIQWKALSSVLAEVGYKDELLALTVRGALPSDADEGKLWSVAELQHTVRAWIDGVELMLLAEKSAMVSGATSATGTAFVVGRSDSKSDGEG